MNSVSQAQAQFRAAVSAVTIDAFAHRDGTPLAGLTATDFVVRDNGVIQRINAVGVTASAHVIIVLDVSRSVQGQSLDRMRAAVGLVFKQLTSADRVSLVTFGNRVRIVLRAATPEVNLTQLVDTLVPSGSTVLHDALVTGTALAGADNRPAVLLMLTDGQDTGSWSTAAATLDAIKRSDLVVYPIGAGLPALSISSLDSEYMRERTWLAPHGADTLRLLQSVADASGGQFLRVDRGAPVDQVFTRILAQYRSRYLITFTPTSPEAPGWHRLDVSLRNREGTVEARQGYMAPTP